MTTQYRFKIEKNSAGQRVVIIDENLYSENYEDIAYEDFDAVLYTTTDIPLLYRQFTTICSLFSHNAFQFKPTFFSPLIEERPLISSCDGLADDINSQILIDETMRIQARMADLGFKIFFTEPGFWSVDRHFYAFCRHCLSRSNKLPKMEIVKGSPFGYLHPILYVMLKGLGVTPAKFLEARSKFVGEFSYMTPDELVAIVHVCPKCLDKGLIYHETCPKCGSIDISEQTLLHHFRCANISAEHTYMRDGKLICPKCLRELRHIGVDYDRPATAYNCNKCSINFSTAKMVCECESCLTKSNIESLVPIPMYNVSINALGVKMLAITNDFQYTDDTVQFPNILTYNQFKDILKVRVNIASSKISDSSYNLRVYRASLVSSEAMNSHGAELIDKIYAQIPHAMIAVKGAKILVAIERGDRLSDEQLSQLTSKSIKYLAKSIINIDYIEYKFGVSPSQFVESLI